ncbi:hypothetical protein CVT24_006133 [Panaeolus cyanescens]|uniref:F-box domain-containing protein n=1 Tax=Panaeolus cyanescens TaxID=181874 RepID=A0A409WZN1_9AGAR|nr:hypothetical protein CVT24_006133 [Panaeolus cyanescens]
MSQLDSRQQTPVFPLEIFGIIIEIIARSSPNYPSLGSDELEKLAACSLTCSSLHELCRRQIFRSVSIRFNSHSGKKLLRLMGILKAKPVIKTEIVDVFVSLLSSDWDQKKFNKLKRNAHHPSTFPAVQRLRIVDGNTFTEGGRYHARPAGCPEFAQNFCRELIESYTKLPTLRFFYNRYNFRARDIPYIALGCPTLQLTDLHLLDIGESKDAKLLSSFKVPPLKQLKRLTIENCTPAFLCILSQTTSVLDLTISGKFEKLKTLPTPVCKLEVLKLDPDDRSEDNGLSPAFDLLWQTNRLGFKPISTLKNLSVGVIAPEDLSTLNKMFAELRQLQSLTINGGPHASFLDYRNF